MRIGRLAWMGLLALLLVQVGCLATNPVHPKGFQESRSTRAELEESFAPQRWAVVVGVPAYQDPTWSKLRYTGNDAGQMARVLKESRYGGFDRVILLSSAEGTTRESILAELRRLRNDLRRQDTFVFYFSGHGSLELSQEGVPSFYLAASDSRSNDLWGTGIELNALRDFLDALKPQRKVMVLDNCFAGDGKSRVATSTQARLRGLVDPFSGAGQVFGRSEAVLLASTFGGTAQEDDRLGSGTYTYYLLQALTSSSAVADVNQDGAVTVYEAHDFARSRTVEHTRSAQVPEGFFRVLGQADIYLSGRPNAELANNSALVYAYGLEPGSAMSVVVDGRAKGTFPRTIPIEPGRRRITLKDSTGHVLADGEVELTRGRIYPLGELMEELSGYRRFLGVEVGGMAQRGAVSSLWGDQTRRIGLTSGYRVRTGALSGLTLSLDAGWTQATEGDWKALARQQERSLVDAGVRVVLRRPIGPLQGGIGWHVHGIYTSAVDALDSSLGAPPDSLRILDRWLSIDTGPVFWQGYALKRNLLVGLQERGSWIYGSFDGQPASSSFQGSVSLGLEVGF